MSNIYDKFSDFVITCQFIEEQLRKGILLCATEIELSLIKANSKAIYNISYEELRYLSMRELLKRFDRFIKDRNLIKDLYALNKIRNIVVHKEFLILAERKKLIDNYLDEGKTRLDGARKIADNCFERLTNLLSNFNKI